MRLRARAGPGLATGNLSLFRRLAPTVLRLSLRLDKMIIESEPQ